MPINSKEWTTGVLLFNNINQVSDLFDHFYDREGENEVFVDITDEFDEFQDTLKLDWLIAHPSKKETDWNNRTYFMDDVYWNQKKNKIFWKHCVHLDDIQQVRPFIV